MRNTPFKTILFCMLIFSPLSLSALPGVDNYIEDTSGEYVFYKDFTFVNQDAYVGFLYYDDATYAVRYYAPANPINVTPAKDITLYFSVDPEAAHLTFLGEKIVGANLPDDTDIINYLHDLFYELTARRQHIVLTDSTPVTNNEEFLQFGGDVTLTYNALIPLFNLESIRAQDGKPVISLQTAGLLESSADTSFTAFKGLPEAPKDKERSFKKKRGSKAAPAVFQNQSVALDTMWDQKIDNLWLLGDIAVLSISEIPAPQDTSRSAAEYTDILLRGLSHSSEGSFVLWNRRAQNTSGGKISLTNVFYNPENASVTRDFKILTKQANGSYAFLTLSVYESVYQKQKAYFDAIVASYKVNES